MGLMPQSLAGKIQFVESHLAVWQLNATAIGSSPAEITALQTQTTTARAALTAQETAQNNSKTKTAALRTAVDAMVVATSDLIKKVRAKAATDGDSIYQLADIPAPATPSPVPPPGTPFKFAAELQPDGSIELKWKCNNPTGSVGTIYNVFRQLGGAGDFVFVGGVGQKDFIDNSIPAGTAQVVYRIQAVRSSAIGVPGEFTVKFGTGAGGSMTASVTETTPTGPKIAA